MKKTIVFGLLTILLAFGFVGCSDDDNVTTTYTVTFNSKGGSTVQAITGIVPGSTITLPSIPTKGTEIFSGWFTDDNIFSNEFTELTPVTEDITVYAKWISNAINPFIGTWSGTITQSGPALGKSVTLSFSENLTWNYVIAGFMSIKGTYTFNGNSGTLTYIEFSDDEGETWSSDFEGASFPTTHNTATVTGNTMEIVSPGFEGSTIVSKN